MSTAKHQELLFYQQVVTLWEGLCALHKELYDLTCEEYLTLLASDIDKLEQMLPLKEEIIARIGELDKERAELIERLNHTDLFPHPIERAGDLLDAFADIDQDTGIAALKNLNSLLIDIIESLQEQNKRNQIFLNKAMVSIRELKQGFTGKKSFTTYGADGFTRTSNR